MIDVRRSDEVATFVDLIRERFGRVDTLVNNAGGGFEAAFLDVNSKGVLYGIAAAPPYMHSRMLLFIILTPARQLLRYSNGLYPGFLYNLLELLRMSGL